MVLLGYFIVFTEAKLRCMAMPVKKIPDCKLLTFG